MASRVVEDKKVAETIDKLVTKTKKPHIASNVLKKLTKEERDGLDNYIKEKMHVPGFASKWTVEETRYITGTILDMIRDGYSKSKIYDELVDWWECSIDTSRHYVTEALRTLVKDNEGLREKTRDEIIEMLYEVVRTAKKDKNYKAILSATDQLNKIFSLYVDKKQIDLGGDIKFDFGE